MALDVDLHGAGSDRRRAMGRITVASITTALCVLSLSSCFSSTSSGPGSTRSGAVTIVPPFSSASAFNEPIGHDATIDPDSRGMVSRIARSTSQVANLVEFGIPVYRADARTPRSAVRCTEPWGTCAPEAASPVPIPTRARPNHGSDGAMVVIDEAGRRSYEYWRAVHSGNGTWSASWASINSLDGSGAGSGGSGSGVSRIAGMVTVAEASHPETPIRHALAVSTKFACSGQFRYPATKTDGAFPDQTCLPEGARLQLDPAVNVDKIPGITLGEAMIARTLQQYGAYVVDQGGAALAFLFELAPDASNKGYPGAVYVADGFTGDYFGLHKVPWTRLRVLAPTQR
jgi:hypothetical protein